VLLARFLAYKDLLGLRRLVEQFPRDEPIVQEDVTRSKELEASCGNKARITRSSPHEIDASGSVHSSTPLHLLGFDVFEDLAAPRCKDRLGKLDPQRRRLCRRPRYPVSQNLVREG